VTLKSKAGRKPGNYFGATVPARALGKRKLFLLCVDVYVM
jgi:hypothetical protein